MIFLFSLSETLLVKRNNRTEAGAGEDVDVLGEGAFYVAQRTQRRSPFLTSLPASARSFSLENVPTWISGVTH